MGNAASVSHSARRRRPVGQGGDDRLGTGTRAGRRAGGWESESTPAASSRGWNTCTTTIGHLDAPEGEVCGPGAFGSPDLLMMGISSPTTWHRRGELAEDFLLDFPRTVISWSAMHRHFLNTVCTHIVDIDYNKIKMYAGQLYFWVRVQPVVQQLIKNQNKRNEEKIDAGTPSPLLRQQVQDQEGHRPAQAALQADGGGAPASSRRHPGPFPPDREVGKDILFVTDVVSQDHRRGEGAGQGLLYRDDKIAFVGDNETLTARLQDPGRRDGARRGDGEVGQTATFSYFPNTHPDFEGGEGQPGAVATPALQRPPGAVPPASWAGCSSPEMRCTSRQPSTLAPDSIIRDSIHRTFSPPESTLTGLYTSSPEKKHPAQEAPEVLLLGVVGVLA